MFLHLCRLCGASWDAPYPPRVLVLSPDQARVLAMALLCYWQYCQPAGANRAVLAALVEMLTRPAGV